MNLEKTNKTPEVFKGNIIDVPTFSDIVFRKDSDDMANMVVDFTKLDSSYTNRALPFGTWGDINYHADKKRFLIPPSTSKDNLKKIFFTAGVRMPLKLSADIADFTGEVFSMDMGISEWKYMFQCRISSISGKEGPFGIDCQWLSGTDGNRIKHDLVSENDLLLDNSKSWTFSCPIPFDTPPKGCAFNLGKNHFSNYGDESVVGSTIEISRLEITCPRFKPHLGFEFQMDDTYPLIRYSWGRAAKAGVKKWDVIVSVNGVTTKKDEAINMLYNYELGKPLKVVTYGADKIYRELIILE